MLMPFFAELAFPRLDPAMITIPALGIGDFSIGPILIRWYAMAYIGGAIVAYYYVKWLSRRRELFGAIPPPTRSDLEDIAFNVLLGIFVGGRLGYVLFYLLPYDPGGFFADPLVVLRVWEGGMSFHGGLIGTIVALLLTARAQSMPPVRLLDLAAISSPFGLFFGRIANFINGELWGRATDVPWAMRFPRWDESTRSWIATGDEPLVHPSQLYEAALEGVLLFTILAIGTFRFKILARPGTASALYMLIYACARMFVEQFRQPDAHIGTLPGGITMGALLSIPMLAMAALMATIAWRYEGEGDSVRRRRP